MCRASSLGRFSARSDACSRSQPRSGSPPRQGAAAGAAAVSRSRSAGVPAAAFAARWWWSFPRAARWYLRRGSDSTVSRSPSSAAKCACIAIDHPQCATPQRQQFHDFAQIRRGRSSGAGQLRQPPRHRQSTAQLRRLRWFALPNRVDASPRSRRRGLEPLCAHPPQFVEWKRPTVHRPGSNAATKVIAEPVAPARSQRPAARPVPSRRRSENPRSAPRRSTGSQAEPVLRSDIACRSSVPANVNGCVARARRTAPRPEKEPRRQTRATRAAACRSVAFGLWSAAFLLRGRLGAGLRSG